MALQNPSFWGGFLGQNQDTERYLYRDLLSFGLAILGLTLLGTRMNDETPKFTEYVVCHAK